MTSPTLPAADRKRAAELLLATLDGDSADANRVLDEAYAAAGISGVMGLLAAMSSGTVELLVSAVGEDNARKTLSMAINDAEVDGA